MGRIRTKLIKRLGKEILKKYLPIFTEDFQKNKKILEKIAEIRSKRLRNILAGYITHLYRKIKEGKIILS